MDLVFLTMSYLPIKYLHKVMSRAKFTDDENNAFINLVLGRPADLSVQRRIEKKLNSADVREIYVDCLSRMRWEM